MTTPAYRALLLDLDGTLLDHRGELSEANASALRRAHETGVRVMIATGRSRVATLPVLDALGLGQPAVVFNGAGLLCPERDEMLEERTLSNKSVARLLAWGEEHDEMTIVMTAHEKRALRPRNAREERSLRGLIGLDLVDNRDHLHVERTMRVTFLSERFATSEAMGAAVNTWLGQPAYVTDFPLSILVDHRGSPVHSVDVHAPCRGKAEALRVLEERFGIPAAEVVAVGDASNDVPMLREAGLGVAMAGSMPSALAAADRVIGGHETDAIAELVGELFG